MRGECQADLDAQHRPSARNGAKERNKAAECSVLGLHAHGAGGLRAVRPAEASAEAPVKASRALLQRSARTQQASEQDAGVQPRQQRRHLGAHTAAPNSLGRSAWHPHGRPGG